MEEQAFGTGTGTGDGGRTDTRGGERRGHTGGGGGGGIVNDKDPNHVRC